MTDYERVETDYFELLKYYEEDDFVDIDLWPGDNFVGHLMITIYGTKDTPYENGRFIFEIKLKPIFDHKNKINFTLI